MDHCWSGYLDDIKEISDTFWCLLSWKWIDVHLINPGAASVHAFPAIIAVKTAASHGCADKYKTICYGGNEEHCKSQGCVHVGVVNPGIPVNVNPEIESQLGIQDDGIVGEVQVPLGNIAANDGSDHDEEERDEQENDHVEEDTNVIYPV